MPESPYPMIPIETALDLIMQAVQPLPSIYLPFDETKGLVLAEDVTATENMPPFPAAAVDGYALIASDTNPRHVVGEQMAGYVAEMTLKPGTAARITTGAPVPPGADAVVMVEYTHEADGQLTLTQPINPGDNIRPVGVDIQAGQTVLTAGSILHAAEIGLLATVGQNQVPIYPRPVVAVMSTGDELVEPHHSLKPGQIRDANRFTLMSAAQDCGATTIDLGIVRDQENTLGQTIERGLAQADVLVTSGGVSMGQLDLVKPYLAEHGTLHFGRVNTKPGKPVTFGVLKEKPFFAMPGYPVSALVSFEVFVRPALLKMAGHNHTQRPRRQVRLNFTAKHSPGRTEFQRVVVSRAEDGSLVADTTGKQSSGRLLSMHGANALIILPHGQGDYPEGSVVTALLLEVLE